MCHGLIDRPSDFQYTLFHSSGYLCHVVRDCRSSQNVASGYAICGLMTVSRIAVCGATIRSYTVPRSAFREVAQQGVTGREHSKLLIGKFEDQIGVSGVLGCIRPTIAFGCRVLSCHLTCDFRNMFHMSNRMDSDSSRWCINDLKFDCLDLFPHSHATLCSERLISDGTLGR